MHSRVHIYVAFIIIINNDDIDARRRRDIDQNAYAHVMYVRVYVYM